MPLLNFKSKLHGIMQPPWLIIVSTFSGLSKPLPFIFVQIKALPNETNHTDVLHGLLRPKPKIPALTPHVSP